MWSPENLRLWLHPRAPAEVRPDRPPVVFWAYHHDTTAHDFVDHGAVRWDPRRRCLQATPKLDRLGIVGDPSRQFYGMGGPFFFFADFTRRCVDCHEDFVFTAKAQRFWFEDLRATVDAAAIRCTPCRKAARGCKAAHRRWSEAGDAWGKAQTAANALLLAESGVDLVERGAGTMRVLDEVVGALRTGVRLSPEDTHLEGWLAVTEAARNRPEACRAHAEAFLQRTERRHDHGTKALRKRVKALVRVLDRQARGERLI